MKRICLSVVGMYFMLLHAFGQGAPTTTYSTRKLSLEEVDFVSSYYNQTADKSAVMGGRTDAKGVGDVTDLANGLELKFMGWKKGGVKHSLTAGLGVDYHTAASQAYVDSNGTARNYGTRIYPTLDWTVENERKGTEFGMGLYYSAEHNYYHSFGLNTSFSKKNRSNGEFQVKLTGYFDQIKMIKPAEFNKVDTAKSGSTGIPDSLVYITTASGQVEVLRYSNGQAVSSPHTGLPSESRNTLTASFSFSQIINQRLQGSVALDLVYQNGYLGLPFHRVYFNNGKDTIENLPSTRFKLPIGLRLNYFLGDNIILRTYYRFYVDSWGLVSNTASLEVPIKITPFFSVSPFYRFYTQTAARYFAPYASHSPDETYYSSNYALAAFQSHFFGAGIRLAPPKGVLFQQLASLELRYGRYTQTTNLQSNVISLHLKFK